jgi:2-dehydropantoate 2-reductase
MRIAVFGSGAVGGYFGGRLAEAGQEVHFIARGQHLAAIREQGLRVSSIDGDFLIERPHATDDPSSPGPVDLVLLGVKAWQVPQAAQAMRPLVGGHTLIVPLQNGVEAPEQLAAALGASHVLGGLCRLLVYLVGPGQVRHAGVAPYLAFGELDGSRSRRTETLREVLAQSRGVTVELSSDIRAAMWSKFVFITALGGVAALTRAPIGVTRSQPESRRLLQQALSEIQAVAVGQGIALPPETVAKTLAFIDTLPPDGTASMQRDIIQGRPSELEAQVGAVIRLSEGCGVPVPLHRLIYAALLPLERRARGELDFAT